MKVLCVVAVYISVLRYLYSSCVKTPACPGKRAPTVKGCIADASGPLDQIVAQNTDVWGKELLHIKNTRPETKYGAEGTDFWFSTSREESSSRLNGEAL